MATVQLGPYVEADLTLKGAYGKEQALPVYMQLDSIINTNHHSILQAERRYRLRMIPLHRVDLIVITDPTRRMRK